MAGRRATEGAGGSNGVHYGRRNAETDELYHAHRLEKQLEDMAHEEAPGASAAEPVELPGPQQGRPRRAEAPEDGLWRQALQEAVRRVDALAAAARLLARKSADLVRLPAEMLRRARRQARGRPRWI